jgi:hypothetical protein
MSFTLFIPGSARAKDLAACFICLVQMIICANAQSKLPLFVDSSGKVGIGKVSPTAALDVNGRVRDSSGFLMPVSGSIIYYWGLRSDFEKNGVGKKASNVEGWALCDGQNGRPAALFSGIGEPKDIWSQYTIEGVIQYDAELFPINWGIRPPLRLSPDYSQIIDDKNVYRDNLDILKRTIFNIIRL